MNLTKILCAATVCILPLTAAPVMKITLKSGALSEEKVAAISALEFTSTSLVTPKGAVALDQIRKITFYDDGTAIGDAKTKQAGAAEAQFVQTGTNLSLTIPQNREISVSLYGLNGRKVKELFTGMAESKPLSLDVSGVASGVYTVVVNAGTELFVRKIMVP